MFFLHKKLEKNINKNAFEEVAALWLKMMLFDADLQHMISHQVS
jgi:hypothetical protein